eukprot:comp21682_c0_seq1/m.48157 comp21682_c0_seq1/g.48157  ORF comp21682_c0_seq1/g.48157 comp21682_c0_seq1/m.48157 type:complete len:324 (-) comp21682_c0_seq1:1069-2040(-)
MRNDPRSMSWRNSDTRSETGNMNAASRVTRRAYPGWLKLCVEKWVAITDASPRSDGRSKALDADCGPVYAMLAIAEKSNICAYAAADDDDDDEADDDDDADDEKDITRVCSSWSTSRASSGPARLSRKAASEKRYPLMSCSMIWPRGTKHSTAESRLACLSASAGSGCDEMQRSSEHRCASERAACSAACSGSSSLSCSEMRWLSKSGLDLARIASAGSMSRSCGTKGAKIHIRGSGSTDAEKRTVCCDPGNSCGAASFSSIDSRSMWSAAHGSRSCTSAAEAARDRCENHPVNRGSKVERMDSGAMIAVLPAVPLDSASEAR